MPDQRSSHHNRSREENVPRGFRLITGQDQADSEGRTGADADKLGYIPAALPANLRLRAATDWDRLGPSCVFTWQDASLLSV